MKKLSEILRFAAIPANGDWDNTIITGITSSSKEVINGSLFFAMKGVKADGHQFIEDAIASGAAAVVCEYIPDFVIEKSRCIQVENSQKVYALAASAWYENPSSQLKIIGVTGTNGKTTTATLLHSLFNSLGEVSGLISTIRYVLPNTEYAATHTTPDAMVLNRMFAEMVDAGCTYCFMEVSSHAVVQDRIHGISFHGGVFTNLTHDHLDYHGTFAAYLKAKQQFFDSLPDHAFALYNDDDPNGKVMVQHTKARKFSYALKRPADFKTKILHNTVSGLGLLMNNSEAWFRLVGMFNAYNLTAIFGTAVLCGFESRDVLIALSALKEVDGRFNVIRSEKGITGVVDYAHTPDALKNVLTTLAEINEDKGRIITVAGAGGDRDPSKRPVMGKIIAEYSHQAIITSDNPRTENPNAIIEAILSGIDVAARKRVLCISDRREAIKTACMMATAGDIILVAGKGHETYQEINGERFHFNDAEILEELLKS